MISKQPEGNGAMSSIEQSLSKIKQEQAMREEQPANAAQIVAAQLGQVQAQYALQCANMSVVIAALNKEVAQLKDAIRKLNTPAAEVTVVDYKDE